MSATSLSLATIDYPFETLALRAASDPPKLILNPDFQREYKWDKEGWGRSSKFIESCLMRIPLPSCYFAEDKSKAHLVIDGVQRITTIIKYMNNEFSLEGLTILKDLNGKKFSDLGTYAADLESTTIRCIVLRRENPKELIAEIFARLNRGAVELSDQEIRHALFAGPFDDLLGQLAQMPLIADFKVGKSGKSKKNSREGEELVLRYFAFKNSSKNYSDSLSNFLDQYMSINADAEKRKISKFKLDFEKSLNACLVVFDNDEVFTDINSDRSRQGIVYYDLLMKSLGEIDSGILKSKRDSVRSAFQALCRSSNFKKLTAGGVQRANSISRRDEMWAKKLMTALK